MKQAVYTDKETGITYKRLPADRAARYYRSGADVILCSPRGEIKRINRAADGHWLEAVRNAFHRTTTAGVMFFPIHESNATNYTSPVSFI